VFHADVSASRVLFNDEPSVVGYFSELTDSRKLPADLRTEASRYRALVETTDTGYVIVDPKGVVLDANDEYVRLCGAKSRNEVIGRSVLDWSAPHDREKNRQAITACMAAGRIRNFKVDYVDGTGAVATVEINATVLGGDTPCILTLCRDVSERRANAQAASESEEMFRQLIEGAPEAIFVQTRGKISYVNSAARAHFGAASDAEILDTDLMERIHPDFRNAVGKRIARINTERAANPLLELVHLRLDGSPVPVEVSAVPVEFKGDRGALVFVRNITERKRTEEALRNAQRLESIGVLAGGIAHDFNNLLTGIFGNIDMARVYLASGDGDGALGALTTVTDVLDRARSLTRQLLTFARGGSPLRKPVDLGRLILAAAKFSLSGSNIECRFHLAPDLWWCSADENQYAQVLDNLVINACQAMPSGGTLDIRAQNRWLGPRSHVTLHGGPYVSVDVRDTGIGIPSENIDHVFDPFFSTKKDGSGLGLATAYSIIKRHGGVLEVESTVGRGTTFYMLVPALPEHTEVVAEGPSGGFRGQGAILVLDDERFVIAVLAKIVESVGFSLQPAVNADEAVRVMADAQAAGTPIQIAILDLTIPGSQGGKEVAGRLRAINPDVKLIVSSGYSEDPVMAEPARFGFHACLVKPYTAGEVHAVLRQTASAP
jgi:two-component system cell cycle sensor histidine kinase/response regulator CckA